MVIRMLALAIFVGGLAPAMAQAQAAASDPLSSAIRAMYEGIKRNIVESAAKMPEEHYGFKPTPEVRSFGELLGHIANTHYSYCSTARGEKNPNAENLEKKGTKADLQKALDASLAFCDAAYATMTDAKAVELIPAGQAQVIRVQRLLANIAHDNEHYGNLVTYMRMKGLVPPSTERAQQRGMGQD